MKLPHRLAVSALSVASLTMAMAAPALATSPVSRTVTTAPTITMTGDIQVIASGHTADGGWMEFTGTGMLTIDDTKPVASGEMSTQALITHEVGGGTWLTGTTVDGGGRKHCISHYNNPTKTHGSTATMHGLQSRSDDKSGGNWAYANVGAHTNDTCYTNWRTS